MKYGFIEPKTLEKWKSHLNLKLGGYAGAEELPWVKQPKFLHAIVFYTTFTFKQNKPQGWRLFFYFVLKFIYWFRLKFNFWLFLVEEDIYNFIRVKILGRKQA